MNKYNIKVFSDIISTNVLFKKAHTLLEQQFKINQGVLKI